MAVQIGKERFRLTRLGAAGFSVQWLFDSRAEALKDIPLVYEGLQINTATGLQWNDKEGKWTVDADYEGLLSEPDGSLDQTRIVKEEVMKKIEAFPDRELLKEEFGAFVDDNDRLRFTEFLPRPPLGATGLSLSSQGVEVPNPLFNVTEYPVEVHKAVWRLVRKRVPQEVKRMSRTVIKRLPRAFRDDVEVDQWYVHPYETDRRGDMVTITVEFEEANEQVDARAVRILARKAREKGLTTGSL